MILAVDIGNTTIGYCGLERKQILDYEICFRFKMDNLPSDSIEEHVKKIIAKFEECQGLDIRFQKKRIEGIAVSSVVPEMTNMVCDALRIIFDMEPYIIRLNEEIGMTFDVDFPEKVGNDRICDAVMAAAVYELPVITVDLGTATTVNVIDRRGCFIGGAIMPGLETGFHALTRKAAQLYEIPISSPKHYIGRNTSDCMNIGAVVGMAGAVDGIISHMEQELGEQAALVLTGGCAGLVSPLISHAHVLDPDLLSKGIAYIYENGLNRVTGGPVTYKDTVKGN